LFNRFGQLLYKEPRGPVGKLSEVGSPRGASAHHLSKRQRRGLGAELSSPTADVGGVERTPTAYVFLQGKATWTSLPPVPRRHPACREGSIRRWRANFLTGRTACLRRPFNTWRGWREPSHSVPAHTYIRIGLDTDRQAVIYPISTMSSGGNAARQFYQRGAALAGPKNDGNKPRS